jgi:acyl-CoA hydrolase/GNAT superfamily N-acetyltransferase
VKSLYWADNYVERLRSADEAMRVIKRGQRVFIGSACGQPRALVRALSQAAKRLSGLEIVRMLSQETTSLTAIADQTGDVSLNVRNIYLGAATDPFILRNRRFITPLNMSTVPTLFLTEKFPIDVALIQVSPPDDFGWMSLGISVDVTLAAARSARQVIAQVNPRMPRVLGQSFINVNDVDVIVEEEEPLLAVSPAPRFDAAMRIGKHIARLIEDGATLQIGLDAMSQATVQALSDKNDLGLHSQYITDDIMHLYAQGIINNQHKGYNEGKLVASAAIGSQNLYEFVHDNPAVDFYPSDIVNDPGIISRHNHMTSMNVAKAIDLTGQVTVEASEHTYYAGVSGILDFVRGALGAPDGRSILMLPSTNPDGTESNIVASLNNLPVIVPRSDVHYVVTEYGVVNLFGKSLQERVMAMIEIAHPDFRDELFEHAKQVGFVSKEHSLGDAAGGIYPLWLEESIHVDDETITIRPAKPVDERRIQEHYYRLAKEDIMSRFFHEKTSFGRREMAPKLQIDYVKDLTLLAVVGEFGFGRVVAVGECMHMPDSNMAEVAFSVHRQYQGKGLSRRILGKLAQEAKKNGIAGLVAYTAIGNKAMVNLFRTLPYKVKKSYDSDGIKLSCRFDEPEEPEK